MTFEVLNELDKDKVIELINKSFNKNITDIELTKDNYNFVGMKEDNVLLVVAMLTNFTDPVEKLKKAHVDYFCVNENYRGKGIGRLFFDEMEKYALSKEVDVLELTSNPKRETARRLYMDKGMIMLDTNVFIKNIKR